MVAQSFATSVILKLRRGKPIGASVLAQTCDGLTRLKSLRADLFVQLESDRNFDYCVSASLKSHIAHR